MPIQLHGDAASNFNQKAEALLGAIAEIPPLGTLVPLRIDPFISQVVDLAEGAAKPRLRLTDPAGNPYAVGFRHEGRWMGFKAEEYVAMRRLAEGMGKTSPLRDTISTEFLEAEIIEWARERDFGTHTRPMTEVVLEKGEAAIRRYEVWIPIATCVVEESVSVGRVLLKNIPRHFFEEWRGVTIEAMKDRNPEEQAKARAFLDDQQQRLQGLTVAAMEVSAEPIRARELAFVETEEALALFRYLSPSNIDPRTTSLCAVLGKERQEGIEYFLLREGRLSGRGDAFVRAPRPEIINAEQAGSGALQKMLATMTRLLTLEKQTPFQEAILNAFLLYGRNSLTPDLAEKLMYIVAALESVLLKNDTEPIQRNLAERMAFLLAKDGTERRRIVEIVRSAYGLRSRFLHHGQSIEDVEAMRQFMMQAWMAMGVLLTKLDAHRTVQEFVDAIEDVKFSAG